MKRRCLVLFRFSLVMRSRSSVRIDEPGPPPCATRYLLDLDTIGVGRRGVLAVGGVIEAVG